ncbi:hypothetical protein GO491_11880 [Flavobacteriaceae bacterium Ap0902]|nr:hypothetical protein [Flavobacteriaceae bacterium Ap0902]
MKLNFMTEWSKDMPEHLAEEPTYFIEKILNSMHYDLKTGAELNKYLQYNKYGYSCKSDLINEIINQNSKKHTIRFMTPERAKQWEGNMIDFYVKDRTKDAFKFAPRVPVTTVQRIKIIHHRDFIKGVSAIFINDNRLSDQNIHELAKNDGFNNGYDFFAYFNQERIESYKKEGKYPYIIHWTDLKY